VSTCLLANNILGTVPEAESHRRREAFFIEFAERLRPHIKIARLAVTGGFRSAEAMAEAIQGGACDIIGMARPIALEPDLPASLSSGQTKAAKPNLTNEATQTASTHYVFGELSNGRPLPDFSDPTLAKAIDDAIARDPAGAWKYRPRIDTDGPNAPDPISVNA